MSNYVAIFILQYLVSGPLRAPGSQPETRLLPRTTWLPFIFPGTRAHAGILIAIVAAGLVWMLLQKMPLGYELIVTGFNPMAARYAGIDVGRRLVLAAFFAGGLGGLAGLVEVLGSQHRLMDGISGGVGFVGIIVALLARLNPLAVIPTALLYGGMSVGADAMQRRASIPSSITFILQSLAVLLVLAVDALRYYRINFSALAAAHTARRCRTGAAMTGNQFVISAFVVTWLSASLRLAGPVLLAALGETFAEQSGVLNVGIEGTMLLGALASFLASYYTGMIWVSLLIAVLAGIVVNLFLAWMYVTVRASQVVAGLVFNVLALGIASTVYRMASAIPRCRKAFRCSSRCTFHFLATIPGIGPVLFGQTILFYLTLVLAFVSHFVLFRTNFGLALRASGENPAAADSAGISVPRMRYAGTLISGAAAGVAGGYLVLAQVGLFRETIVSGQGFIALGIVIFGRWNPLKATLAAMVFGACDALQLSLQIFGTRVPPQLLLALPYVVTILAISGLFGGKAVQPAALMTPYVKD